MARRPPAAPRDTGIVLTRLSDFRDESEATFLQREAELIAAAQMEGITDIITLRENDLDTGSKMRGKSAHKENLRVEFNGLVGYRTDRPVYTTALRMLQSGQRANLIVGDESRISRNWTDGKALADAVLTGGASVLAIDDECNPRWVMRDGGSREEIKKFYEEIEAARRFSVDIGIKVAKGRRRWAGRSYQGGRRPFGFQVAQDTAAHQRNLVIDDAEAAIIRQAAADILRRGISLNAISRELRERAVPTATGKAQWSSRNLRDVLIKPAVAGLAVRGEALVEAPWPVILDRETWEELRAVLTDPERRTNKTRANEPRWLLSGFARCYCGQTVVVHGGKGRVPGYVGRECGHVRRQAAKTDEWVEDHVLAILEDPANADLLKPPPGPDIDRAALRREQRRLNEQADAKVRMNVRGILTDHQLEIALAEIRTMLADITTQLTTDPAAPDPLADIRGKPARVVWEHLPMARKRVIVQLLIESVTIHPVARKGGKGGFDENTVKVRPRF